MEATSAMRQKPHNTAKLPQRLLEELGGSSERQGGFRKKRVATLSRKEQRKTAREQKKSIHLHTDKTRSSTQRLNAANQGEQLRLPLPISESKVSATSVQPKPSKSILKAPKSAVLSKQAPTSPSSPPPPSRVSRVVRERLTADDAEIAALEKALGVKGNKKLPKSFQSDGLDSLLESIDDAVSSDVKNSSKRKGSEEEQWLVNKRQKSQAENRPSFSPGLSEGSEDDGDGGRSGSEMQGSSEGDDDADQDAIVEENDSLDELNGAKNAQVLHTSRKPRENPYVAPVVGDLAKYIPPSLRSRGWEDPTDLSQLQRQLLGLLNRLSEDNILTILRDVEQMYLRHPRQHVSSTLLDLLMGLLADRTILSDTFIILHAGFIAALYKTIGSDFGAQAIQRIDEEFKQSHGAVSSEDAVGKKMNNLVGLLAYLYVFQVIGSQLIYDLIRLCLEDLSEINVELLLKVVRNAGQQLRRDDPSSLKDIVLQLPFSVKKTGEDKVSVRATFMIETIKDLKDNCMKSGILATTITSEHTLRMKKILGSLNTRSIKAREPLRIGMKDLRNRDKAGIWWLIGSSYKGEDRKMEGPLNSTKQLPFDASSNVGNDASDVVSKELVQLASEQHMNTGVRRSIFEEIMSSSDYNDAYGRILKVCPKSKRVEVPGVIIHCAGAEKTYNPFYTFLSRRFCSDKELRYRFRSSLSSLLRRMGNGRSDFDGDEEDVVEEKLELRILFNLAKMFGILIAEGGLDITALKYLNLIQTQPQTRMFLEILMTSAILRCQQDSKDSRNEKSLLDIFVKPEELKKIPFMVEGVWYFLKENVKRTNVVSSKSDKETVKWACKVACDRLSVMKTKSLIDE